jgi:hypothetical protein
VSPVGLVARINLLNTLADTTLFRVQRGGLLLVEHPYVDVILPYCPAPPIAVGTMRPEVPQSCVFLPRVLVEEEIPPTVALAPQAFLLCPDGLGLLGPVLESPIVPGLEVHLPKHRAHSQNP